MQRVGRFLMESSQSLNLYVYVSFDLQGVSVISTSIDPSMTETVAIIPSVHEFTKDGVKYITQVN